MINPLKMARQTVKTVVLPVKSKAKFFAKYIGISAVGATVAFPVPKLMAPALRDEVVFLKKSIQASTPKTNIIYPFNNYVISWEKMKNTYNCGFELSILKPKVDVVFEKQRRTVLKIMQDDKACLHPNKEQVADNIVKIARKMNLDPIEVACIAKKESHFSQKAIKKAPKGVMQIVEITVKDMFQRELLYHPHLKVLKTDYPTHKELFNAIQNNALVNIEVGALTYGMKLQQAKGNVFNALKKYNASSLQEEYAQTVYNDILKYRKFYKNLDIEKSLP